MLSVSAERLRAMARLLVTFVFERSRVPECH